MARLDNQMTLADVDPEYQGFLDKFKPKKTTDDCYTPDNIYDVVLKWVIDTYGIDPDKVVRPFWPGGDYMNEDYAEIMGIGLKQGRLPQTRGEVSASETWLKMRGWSAEQAIGQVIQTEEGKVKIVGIIKDFQINNYFEENKPFLMHYHPNFSGMIHLRLKEPFVENLQRLNKEAGEAFQGQTIAFESLEQAMTESYNSVRVFRNSTIVATFVIIFITLMGLIGYTNDETSRRSKEIAIRKVNGAEASGIIELLAKDVLWTALPAVLLGTFASWYVGELWMSQFATTMGSTIPYYIMTAFVTLLMIVGVVVVKTWKIANENPVISIKSE